MAGISSKAAVSVENRKKFNGIEETRDLDLNQYDAFFRTMDPQLGRWWQIDPKPEESASPYSSMANNPILKSDPLGDIEAGVNEISARRERKVMRNTFSGKDGRQMRKLFKLGSDGMTFKSIDENKFNTAVSKLKSSQSKALAAGYKNTINSDKSVFVSIIKDNEVTKITNKNLGNQWKGEMYASFNGKMISEGAGGGWTSQQNAQGNYLVIMSMSPSEPIKYIDQSGNPTSGIPSLGETSAHEIVGHALGGIKGLGENNVGSIQVSNMYLNSKNSGKYRDGTRFDGAGHTPQPLSRTVANAIPDYLQD